MLFSPEMFLLDELYPWESQRLSFMNPKVFLLLSNFESLEDKLGEYEDETMELEDKPTPPLPSISKKKRDEENDKDKFKVRVKQNFIVHIIQTANFAMVMLLWLTAIMAARDNLSYNYMNRAIIAKTTGPRDAFDETYSTYITELQKTSAFFRVKQVEDILPFVGSIEYILFNIKYVINSRPSTLQGFTYFSPYMQLRQLRSKVDECNFPEFEIDKLCANVLFGNELTNDLIRNGYVIDYEEGDKRSSGIRGVNDIYPLSGNVIEISSMNYSEYSQQAFNLVEQDWITLNTRYTALTINYFNPSLSAYTSMVYNFVLDLEQDVVPCYQISSFYYEFYSPSDIAISVLLLLACFCMSALLIRDMFKHPQELQHMDEIKTASKNTSLENIRKNLSEWESFEQMNLRRRCHRPDFLSFVVLVSIVGIIIILIVHFIWYFGIMKNEFDVSSSKYDDLIFATQFFDTIVVFQGVITILLSVGILKYSKYWINTMAIMVKMIVVKAQRFLGFCTVSIIGIIGFAMYFYGVLGPYEYRAALNYLALTGMVRLFVGRWFTTDVFSEFISVWYVILPILAFLYFRMSLVMISIINLQWQFMKANEGVLNRNNEDVKRPKSQ